MEHTDNYNNEAPQFDPSQNNATTTTKNQTTTFQQGYVVKYIKKRNYGFLRLPIQSGQDKRKDLFFHKSQIQNNGQIPLVSVGDYCNFIIEQSESGPVAASVDVLSRTKPPVKSIEKNKIFHHHHHKQDNKTKLFKETLLLMFNEATNSKKKN